MWHNMFERYLLAATENRRRVTKKTPFLFLEITTIFPFVLRLYTSCFHGEKKIPGHWWLIVTHVLLTPEAYTYTRGNI